MKRSHLPRKGDFYSSRFVDTATLFVRGGRGGDGCLAFHREKYVPFGGPSGGNGGKGGDVYLVADPGRTTLLDLSLHPHIAGDDGAHGRGSQCHGAGGKDVSVPVPMGTMIYRDGKCVADLCAPGQTVLVARGGRGGRGNESFKSNANKAPRIRERGLPGEEFRLELELKLLADVGLVGLPNAGKSMLLSVVSKARPKVADYPFTTLSPHLGVARHKEASFVVADIPGLIEGAHLGKGLGDAFLRHIERTRLVIHLIDPFGFGTQSAWDGVRTIRREMKSFGGGLDQKPAVCAVTKMDLTGAEDQLKVLRKRFKKIEFFPISSATGAGIEKLLDEALERLSRIPPPVVGAYGFEQEQARRFGKKPAQAMEVEKEAPGVFRIQGRPLEELALATDFALPEAEQRFKQALKRWKVDRRLKRLGAAAGDAVWIGEHEFEWTEDAPK
ncbi:MAG: GTPase ObgE [Elusimicrobia bacterium]|nr:GTPase ObgE [Elusimicrobiota bacterium]